MRPGRLDSSTTRSARRTASRTLWVTKMTVRSVSRQIRSSSSWSRSRVMASRAPNGSSISRIRRSWARARARATRWRMPPESSWGRLVAKPSRRTSSSSSLGPGLAGGLADARGGAGPARRCGSTLSQGNSAASWNIRVASPAGPFDPAGRRPVQPGDQVEQGALATAGRPDEADELARGHLERDPIEGRDRRPHLPVHLGHRSR